MIRAALVIWLRWRAKHHAERAQIFGMAVLAARQRRDFTAAGYFWEQLEKARSKRDLLTVRASSIEIRASGGRTHGMDCNEGRTRSARYDAR